MFDQEGSAPDVLDSSDPAVRRCDPPVPVWVDLAALTQQQRHGRGYRSGGVFVGGVVRAVMWAQVMTDRAFWLGIVTCELDVVTQDLVDDHEARRVIGGRPPMAE
jgi:hypothetical protein